MSGDFTIGDAQIDRLKHHLLHDFKAYADFYTKRNGERVQDRKKKFRPVWAEYVNGSKTKREDKRWLGVFRRWLEEIGSPADAVWKYEQYGIDCLLRTDGDRGAGDYKILVALHQGNDPDEVALDTRRMYDFNIPEKVVLIWSSAKRGDIKEIADQARVVPELAAARGVKNIGNTHVVVANRQIRDWWLESRQDPPEHPFEYFVIESQASTNAAP